MKKLLYILILVSLPGYTYSQTSDKQYFTCSGQSFNGQLPVDSKKDKENVEVSRKFTGSMMYQKNDPKKIKTVLDPEGFIVFSHKTYEVCWTDPVQLKFREECGISTKSKNVKKIEETGNLDKVTGKFYYENTYEYEGKTYWNGYVLTCKKVDSPVVQ